MKILDYIYFNIFSWYNIDGSNPRFKDKATAAAVSAIVMAGGFGFWIMFIDGLTNYLSVRKRINSIPAALLILITTILYVILHIRYVKNRYYIKVLDSFLEYDKIHKVKGRVLVMGFFIAFPFLTYLILGMFILP